MKHEELFTQENRDYLVELMNIGAGNAATALNQLLTCEVDIRLPDVCVTRASQATATVAGFGVPVTCMRMRMVGDLTGNIIFVVPDDQRAKLIERAEQSLLGPTRNTDPDRVIADLGEIGNILAGVYLTALHDFCRLQVCHSVPMLAPDLLQTLAEDANTAEPYNGKTVILVTNEFIVDKEHFKTYLLIFPTDASLDALVDSMKNARAIFGYKEG